MPNPAIIGAAALAGAMSDQTTLVRDPASGDKVYAVVGGAKYWVPSADALIDTFGGGAWDRVRNDWSQAKIDALTTRPWSRYGAAAVGSGSTTLVSDPADTAGGVYAVVGGSRFGIPDSDTLTAAFGSDAWNHVRTDWSPARIAALTEKPWTSYAEAAESAGAATPPAAGDGPSAGKTPPGTALTDVNIDAQIGGNSDALKVGLFFLAAMVGLLIFRSKRA